MLSLIHHVICMGRGDILPGIMLQRTGILSGHQEWQYIHLLHALENMAVWAFTTYVRLL